MGDTQTLPEKTRLYVIGDIHGRLDGLDRLIDAIKRDVDAYGDDCLTVTLGDYIDRGANSRGCDRALLANPFPTPYITLKGNHEMLFQSFPADSAVGEDWRRLGGRPQTDCATECPRSTRVFYDR